MSQTTFTIDSERFQEIEKLIHAYPENAEETINKYLHTTGGELIRSEIMRLLPASGRKWKKKLPPASAAAPFGQKDDNLSVAIGTGRSSGSSGKYNYLYFPDDGANTKRHYGNQHFMQAGAANVVPRIIDDMSTAIIQKFSEE